MGAKDFLDFCVQNETEISDLVEKFSDYEPNGGVTEQKLSIWLKQFQPQHRALALKLAARIYYYGIHDVNGLMKPMHKLVLQQIEAVGAKVSDALFVPFGLDGESGVDIVRRYRNINNLHSWQSRFVRANEIVEKTYAAKNPVIVFIDDFVGTGDQVEGYWNEVLCLLVPEHFPMFLTVIAALPGGADYIESTTPIKVIQVHTIQSRYQIGNSACKEFSSQEKHTLKRYCTEIGNKPFGHGDCELLLSFAYGTPNNTISVIRGSKGQRPWRGLLPGWGDLQV